MARQSGRTVRAILGVGADVLTTVELWFWEAYDSLEPMGSEVLMLAKQLAAAFKEQDPYKFMPSRCRNMKYGELGSREHQLNLAMKLEAFAKALSGQFN